MSIAIRWIDTKGVSWDLVSGPVRLTRAGLKGLGIPDVNFQTQESAGVDGQRLLGWQLKARSVFVPVRFKDAGAADVMGLQRQFWNGLQIGKYGTFEVTAPDGSIRTLTMRLADDGGLAYKLQPDLYQVDAVGLTFTADDPWWYGEQVHLYYNPASSVQITHAWTGTAGASTSTESVNGAVTRRNYSTNPGMELGATTGYSTNPYGPQGTLAASTDRAHTGTYSGKYVAAGGANNEGVAFNIDAGQRYANAWVFNPSANGMDHLTMTGVATDGRTEPYITTTVRDQWVRLQIDLGTGWPGGAVFVYCNDATANAGAVFYWDDVSIGDQGDYFDGSSGSYTNGDGGRPFFGGAFGGYGPPFYISKASGTGEASFTNPSDQPLWLKWFIPGPFQSFDVNVDGHHVAGTISVLTGRSLAFDTDPGNQVIATGPTPPGNSDMTPDTVIPYWQMSAVDFAPIQPGATSVVKATLVGGITGTPTIYGFGYPRYERAF